MKKMLTMMAALMFAIAPAAFAQGPVGTWEIEIDTGDAVIESQLVIGEDMKGVLINELGEVPLSDVEFDDGVLTFTGVVPYQGEELNIEFEGDIDGDEVDGYLYTDLGEAPVYGERAVVITAVGTWDIEIDAGGTILENQLIFPSNSKGKMISADGEYDLTDVELDGETLIFNVTVKFNEEDLEIEFEGDIDGNEIDGMMYTAIGDATVYGERRGAGVLVGTWDCEVDTGDQIIESQLVFTSDSEGKQVTEAGEIEFSLVELDGEDLIFELTIPFDGQELDIEFEGTVEDGEIDGYIYTDLGEAPLVATKVE